MAYLKVETNTNPIPATMLLPTPFAFPSGGNGGNGGGGGGTVIANHYNANGKQMNAPVSVPVNTEVDLASFNITLVGGKQALMLAFADFSGAAIDANLKLYVAGAVVSQTHVSTGQSISWGLLVPTVPGLTAVKIAAENIGGAPLPVPSATVMLMEFLQ
jgi:hypothetical protein